MSHERKSELRNLGLIYAVTAFIVVHLVFIWFIFFLANVFVAPTADGPQTVGTATAFAINVGLIVLFGLQHSVMARPKFKALWTKIVAKDLERATYVHAANIALIALLLFWQPIDIVLWNVASIWWQMSFWFVFVLGWGLSFAGSLLIDHLELLGIRQCLAWYKGVGYQRREFQSNWLYRSVRHPIQLGLILAFWSSPIMTVGHALLAAGLTAYILIAIRYEERDLVREFGQSYDDYRKATPKLIPRLWRSVG